MYTENMIETLREQNPLTFAKAEELAASWGKSVRSVIAKASGLGVAYQPKPPSPSARSKHDIAADIQEKLGVRFRNLTALTLEDLRTLEAALVQ